MYKLINSTLTKEVVIIAKRIDLVGDTYGEFKVIEMLYGYKETSGKPRTYCRCIGIDGKEYVIRADALRRNITTKVKYAGFQRNQDITNMKFGLLTALYPTSRHAANGGNIWHCICDCGNEHDVAMSDLKNGHTRSCGCRHRSKWEDFIFNYLSSLSLSFEEQKRFKDCTNAKSSDMLPFDFYIPKYNLIIEYDGLHHFEPVKGWGGKEKFLKTKENDNIKNEYCKNNKIRLLRIPFYFSQEEIMKSINQFISPVTTTA